MHPKSYKLGEYPVTVLRKRNELYAALPVIVCMLLPLAQLAGLVYFYDIALGIAFFNLKFPHERKRAGSLYRKISILLIFAILVGLLSGIIRSGQFLRPTIYTIQYLLGLVYARAVYENIIAGRLDLQRFASVIVWGGVVLAGIGIFQFLLFQINPFIAAELQRQYLSFSGFDTGFFDRRYMAMVWNVGMVRIMGTWDVTTTYAGMLALSAAWLLIAKPGRWQAMILFGVIMLALMMTGSRHGWTIMVLLLFGLAGGSMLQRISIIATFVSFFIAVLLIVNSQTPSDTQVMSLVEQITARSERTVEQGLDDSSIQLRYAEGTERFLSYALQDPTMLIAGVGTGTDKALYETLDTVRYDALMYETRNLGFASNSWLLIWRNWGILGFAGLTSLFVYINRLRGSAARYGLLISGLILLSDNYAVHVARCFFLLFLFLTALAAQGVVERKNMNTQMQFSD